MREIEFRGKRKTANLANTQKLYYCDKKMGSGTCSNIATRQVDLRNRKNKDMLTARTIHKHRCEEHATTKTAKMVVVESRPFDQSYSLTKINEFLNTLIGKNIESKVHTAKMLRVKYVKPNTGGVMCYQEHSKKWKFVYYDQIVNILT